MDRLSEIEARDAQYRIGQTVASGYACMTDIPYLLKRLRDAEEFIHVLADTDNWSDEMLEDSGAIVQVYKGELTCPCIANKMAQDYFAKWGGGGE